MFSQGSIHMLIKERRLIFDELLNLVGQHFTSRTSVA
jgi:hypothetical protein